jgi:hypothetical protein
MPLRPRHFKKICPMERSSLDFFRSLAAGATESGRHVMPNQRSKDKTYIGGYLDKSIHAEILRMAEQEGMGKNKFGFVTILIQEAIALRKKKAIPAAE